MCLQRLTAGGRDESRFRGALQRHYGDKSFSAPHSEAREAAVESDAVSETIAVAQSEIAVPGPRIC